MGWGTGIFRGAGIAAAAVLLAGCNQRQSALAPFGEDAARIGAITLTMVAGAAIVAIGMAALMWWAVRAPEGRLTLAGGERLILVLGGIVPTILLLALLAYSLPAMRPRAVAPADLRIHVTGEQFWWRVVYRDGAVADERANEVRIPVGRTVELLLGGADVIHSFWIPGLAGKMDMIPGRTNRLVVRATKPGVYRGVCTEFCGLSHALMAFDVIAMEPAAFDAWRTRAPAPSPASPGARLYAAYGCAGCHEGAPAIGPRLDRLGERQSLAAGVLPMTLPAIAGFIRHPERTKPGVRMPAFPQMPPRDALAIAAWLKGRR